MLKNTPVRRCHGVAKLLVLTSWFFKLLLSSSALKVLTWCWDVSKRSCVDTKFSSWANACRIQFKFSTRSFKFMVEKAIWNKVSSISTWAETPITASFTSPFDKTVPQIAQVWPSAKQLFAHVGQRRCMHAVLYAIPSTWLWQELQVRAGLLSCMIYSNSHLIWLLRPTKESCVETR